VIAHFNGFALVVVAQRQLTPKHTTAYQHAAKCFLFQADADDKEQPNTPKRIWLKAF
jgi:hypothetical protein